MRGRERVSSLRSLAALAPPQWFSREQVEFSHARWAPPLQQGRLRQSNIAHEAPRRSFQNLQNFQNFQKLQWKFLHGASLWAGGLPHSVSSSPKHWSYGRADKKDLQTQRQTRGPSMPNVLDSDMRNYWSDGRANMRNFVASAAPFLSSARPPVEEVECVVVGAGVVGLAVARELAAAGREVLLVEAAEGIGSGTSSRNSEVIHAGIYYQPGSLKAQLCVAGRHALYRYCQEKGVDVRACGKLIVATSPDQVPELEALQALGEANGVEGLARVSREEARRLEPELECAAALHSRESGIVDCHALMVALQVDAESAGASFAFRSAVTAGEVQAGAGGGIRLDVCEAEVGGLQRSHAGNGERPPPDLCLLAQCVVNAAGLEAVPLARRLTGLPPSLVPQRHLAKGNYFCLTGGRPPFTRLVYPIPEPGGLGIHVTLDLSGRVKFGPDVQWLPQEGADRLLPQYDYSVDPARADKFYAAIRRYYPGLEEGALLPDYSGLRPKISGPGEAAADFVIQGPSATGVPGLVNLFGIESPGLTSALAIATRVRELLA